MARDERWAAELRRLGGSIHQDDAPPLDEAQDAAQQAGIARYYEMVEGLAHDPAALADSRVAEVVLWSLHPLDDYGIYETAYGALREFTAEALVAAALAVLPAWLQQHGDHASIQCALAPIGSDPDLMDRFTEGAAQWGEQDRERVASAAHRWAREDESWEPLAAALGGAFPRDNADPIPADWSDDWRRAAERFRASGRVDLAWNERDMAGSFECVLAILELAHGGRWREVPDFLNPIRVRRRTEIPGFVRAFDRRPASSREGITTNVERAWPEFSHWLADHRDPA